jgi:putative protease
MPELLAPAGGMEQLRAAVQNGADAVYIGGKAFNARAFANNFDRDETARAADYCHLRGALIYVTLNIMMLEGELEQGVEAARQAYLSGADALIVADMGLADAIKRCVPDIPLHASTQMCVHNAEGARITAGLGFKRAVLARELSLADIRAVNSGADIETEVFVHGALCSGVSGLCLLSSFIGERSGNRGKCAQPCRLEYEINGKNAYYLSMADLCAAGYIRDLVHNGVSSFKIEGRMKNSLYVGGVVREYRRIIDAALEGKDVPDGCLENLLGYYNRTFTSAYLGGGTDVTAIDKPGNRNVDKERPEGYGEEAKEKACYEFTAAVELAQGKPPVLELKCGKYSVKVTGEGALAEAEKPLDKDIVVRSVNKTGGTPFAARDTRVSITDNPYISVSALNSLRKQAIESMENAMLKRYRNRESFPCETDEEETYPHQLKDVFVQTGSADTAIRSLRQGAGRVYYAPAVYDGKNLNQAERIEGETGVKPFIVLPPFLRSGDMRLIGSLLRKARGFFGGALAGNFSQIEILKHYFEETVADYTCNIANRRTMRVYREMGFTGAALSAEMNKKEINGLKGCLPTEIVAYGYLPLMWLAHPLPADRMSDRRGYRYRIQTIKAHSEIYAVLNPVLLAIRETGGIRYGADAVRLILDAEQDVLPVYLEAIREQRDAEFILENTTQGHLKRGV